MAGIGVATGEAKKALDSVKERLDTRYGIVLIARRTASTTWSRADLRFLLLAGGSRDLATPPWYSLYGGY